MAESSVGESDERLVGGYAGRMLLVTVTAWAVLETARFAIPPLLPEIRADLGLTLGQTGIVISVLQGGYALSQYPGGRLSDSLNRTTLLVPALIVLAIGCLTIGTATSYLFILLGATVFGVGKGLYAIPSRALISDLYVRRRGRALGVYAAGTDVGGVLASAIAVVVIAVATWRTSFLPIGVSLLGFAVLFVTLTRDPFVLGSTEFGLTGTVRRLFETPRQRWTIVAYTFFYFSVNGVLNFLPAYLRESKSFSPELASFGFALLFLVGMGVKPLAGVVSDRVSRRRLTAVGLLVSVVALLTLVVMTSFVGIVAAIALFAVSYKGLLPVIDAVVIDAAPDTNRGGDLGATRTVFIGIGGLGAAFVGISADRFGYAVSFSSIAACLLVAAVLIVVQHGD